ncbi:MAG: hypothetical protein PUJ32_06375, partial [Lactobacillus johnsonii]|nr:hypothetical protein [Lactobacillus johnsonii]
CSLWQAFFELFSRSFRLPQTACITLQAFLLFVNIVLNKNVYFEYYFYLIIELFRFIIFSA